MKLEEEMYVRTTKGKIDKIDDYDSTFDCYHLSTEPKCYGVEENDISKASYNIIDLIEVGDYVNGLIVNDIVTDIDGTKTFNLFKQSSYFGNEDIKSIVTKQQFENMQYVID